jgi:hypothetical protein
MADGPRDPGEPLRFPAPRRPDPASPYREPVPPQPPEPERRRVAVHRPEPPAPRWSPADVPPAPELVRGRVARAIGLVRTFTSNHPVLTFLALVALVVLWMMANAHNFGPGRMFIG